MKYEMKIEFPYSLSAYEQVTMRERLEREIQSMMADERIKVLYLAKDE